MDCVRPRLTFHCTQERDFDLETDGQLGNESRSENSAIRSLNRPEESNVNRGFVYACS